MLGIQYFDQSSTDISKYVQKAEKALQRGRLKSALSQYLRVLRIDPAMQERRNRSPTFMPR